MIKNKFNHLVTDSYHFPHFIALKENEKTLFDVLEYIRPFILKLRFYI